MTIKSLLLASATALAAFQNATAADAIVAAEPEPMEYVRVCDAFGKGYFYIPGTETCLKIGGYVRFDNMLGESPYNGINDGWVGHTRATLRYDAASDTEYGTLRSFIEHRWDNTDGVEKFTLISSYIELGGFRAGYSDSRFDKWLDSAGNIINDDVIDYSPNRTPQVSYVYKTDNGFELLIGLEEGNGTYSAGGTTVYYKDEDWPDPLAGFKYKQDWGGISAIIGYDAQSEEMAAKARLDLTLNDVFSIFIMGGYQSGWDNEDGPAGSRQRNFFGSWNGEWAAWSGFAAKVTDKATINGQAAYEEDGTFAAALNVEYKMVSGFKMMPEINYTDFGGVRGDGNAFGGTVRFQRDF
ncbi:opacity protein-like surface antigen [Pararhizobium capsulatum DSM 1112]|uniref:Porin n=1 Tax=Pararhizobium capsulatum DSM 1112 TaxID=1121113 RepID=A0ABU0C4Q3_9HYPH|nr:porin [Pararhizobium capsulatum]MDQ0324067.1 opacity protein-like surface antigen [Pararhizobium capsulatum DSM 1112]